MLDLGNFEREQLVVDDGHRQIGSQREHVAGTLERRQRRAEGALELLGDLAPASSRRSDACTRIGRGWLNRKISLLRTAKICPEMPLGRVGAEIDRERRDLLRRHLLQPLDALLLLLVSAGIESIMRRQGERRDAVRAHAEALHVERDAARQAHDAELGRHVVGLAEIADQAGGRGHVHVSARALLAEMPATRAAHVERAVQVHGDDVRPVGLAHLVEDARRAGCRRC